MKRSEMYSLLNGVKKCASLANKENIEFVYRIGIINEELVKRVKMFEKSRPKPSPKYEEYLDEYNELTLKFALKDQNDNPISTENGIAIKNVLQFKKELKELRAKHNDAIVEQEKNDESFEQFLDVEEADFTYVPIPKKHLPSEITVDQMTAIMAIVEK